MINKKDTAVNKDNLESVPMSESSRPSPKLDGSQEGLTGLSSHIYSQLRCVPAQGHETK